MLNLEQAKLEALEFARNTHIITELTTQAKENGGFDTQKQIWEVKAEYFQPNGTVQSTKLRLFLPDDFPLVMPEIFVDKQFIDDVGYLPHINSKGTVCLYDSTSITLDTSRSGEIVTSALYRAISIIEDGLAKKNTDDFADEFVAYWSEQYGDSDKHEKGLCMVGDANFEPSLLKIDVLEKPFKGFKLILHDECDDYKTFSKYLKEHKHTYIEYPAFYLGTSSMISPPFKLSNSEITSFVEKEFKGQSREFEKFLEQNPYPNFLIFSLAIGNGLSFFGWHLPLVNCLRPGFRPGALKPLAVLTSFQKNEVPARVVLETFTSQRLQTRTTGTPVPKRYRFTFAGLGSIGSNLVPYLLSLESEHLSLIDFDALKIENINRHLLGMSYVGFKKVHGMRIHLQLNNPLLKIDIYPDSVIEVLAKHADILNGSDFMIIAIGVNNVEEYIADALAEGKINKPVFFFWVEPYLMGGHCVYLTPAHSVNFKGLFEDGLYKYNMISKETYKDPGAQIKLREAGCQTSYVPYGRQSITRFLSGIIPTIYKIIEDHESNDLAISWRNGTNVIDGLDIKLSELGTKLSDYQMQVKRL